MAEEVIGLLFGVDGGGSIDGRSGKLIVDDLTKIVNQINQDKSAVPKLQLSFDISKAEAAVTKLKKNLKDIEKIANITVTYREGGGGKGGKGNSIAQEIKSDSKALMSLHKKIYDTKLIINGLSSGVGNSAQIEEYTKQLKDLEDQYDSLVHTFMKKSSANAGDIMFDDIKTLGDKYDEIIQTTASKLKLDQAKLLDANTASEQSERYENLSNSVKKYYSALTELEKIHMKNENVTELNGYWVTLDSQYDERIKQITSLKSAYDSLGVSVDDSGELQIKSAQELGITEAQRVSLLNQVKSATVALGLSNERNSVSIQSAWDKNSAKVHEYIQRVKEVASQNPEVKKMMDEIDEIATSGNPRKLDELTSKFAQLQQKIRETGADVESWGQKMSKTLGTRIRSLLAGIAVGKTIQYLRDVYTNVIKLDEALVNLQIASGKTREETKQLIKEYAGLAKQLGATTIEIANAADTWLRQGYSAEQANALITNSMMLSKLGQMESAEASRALTSAMNGYGVAVEDSVKIVDKFTKVDMEAAASAGDIATAMAETATSAKLAGVSMDKLIGYITTVKEVTQDGSESVGVFLKTLFARMNNVAAGKFIDDETGESLNDVEAVLGKLQISLRDANDEFRNSADVLDEVASRWNEFNSTERNAIATAMAGTRQIEKFNVLMSNYSSAMKYAEAATNSAGTAVDKYGDYVEGIDGKTQALISTFEKLSITILDSDLIIFGLEFLTGTVSALNGIIDSVGGINNVLLATVSILAALNPNAIVMFFKTMIGLFKNIYGGVLKIFNIIGELVAGFAMAKVQGMSTGQAISGAFHSAGIAVNAVNVAVSALVIALSACLITINLVKQSQDKLIQNTIQSANAHMSEAEAVKDKSNALSELISKYEELHKKNDGVWDDESVKSVQQIQDDIVELVGDQARALDLVNGRLNTQLGILQDISEEIRQTALASAEATLTDAEIAIQKSMNKLRTGDNQYYDLGFSGKKNSYGDIQFDAVSRNVMGAATVQYDTIKTNFDTAEEFAKQYEAVLAYKNAIANSVDETDKSEVEFYTELNDFLTEYKEVYSVYKSAKDLIEQLTTSSDSSDDTEGKAKGVVVELKSTLDILEEVQDGYDGLSNAMRTLTSEGYLTADSLSTLLNLQKEGALVGLELSDILTQDANGYKLAGDALEKYSEALLKSYSVTGVFKTQQDKDNAIKNLENLRAVLATLAQTQEDVTDSDKERREELEKQRDAYDNQLDAYKELIDIRKDLLKTYEEELSYQKELEKRQRNVTSLQTKLSVARLDTSAAGQARVRELEDELREAQEELEDFTLEHAIDVLSAQLESQYAEHEALIKGKLDEITNLLEDLDTSPEVNVTVDTTWAQNLLTQIGSMIADVEGTEVKVPEIQDNDTSTDDKTSNKTANRKVGGGSFGTSSGTETGRLTKGIATGGDYSVYGLGDNWFLTGKDDITVKIGNNSYGVKVAKNATSGTLPENLNSLYKNQAYPGDGRIAMYKGELYVSNNGSWFHIEDSANARKLTSEYESYLKNATKHHTGGFVDSALGLKPSEEFAKLLKGEFVSTPAQMKYFMEHTLPQIANYTASGSSNEFNAPLIEITCESVTTESIPKLERIVNEAVKEIQRQLDSGMSRTGYKRATVKRLT